MESPTVEPNDMSSLAASVRDAFSQPEPMRSFQLMSLRVGMNRLARKHEPRAKVDPEYGAAVYEAIAEQTNLLSAEAGLDDAQAEELQAIMTESFRPLVAAGD